MGSLRYGYRRRTQSLDKLREANGRKKPQCFVYPFDSTNTTEFENCLPLLVVKACRKFTRHIVLSGIDH